VLPLLTNTWLAVWVNGWWTVVYLLAAVLHLGHLQGGTAWTRLWHASHVAMALGMINMLCSGPNASTDIIVGELFVAAVVTSLVGLMVAMIRRLRSLVMAGLITVVELAAMGYMFAPSTYRSTLPTVLLAGWFLIDTLGYAYGYIGIDVVAPTGSRARLYGSDGVDAAVGCGTDTPDAGPASDTAPSGRQVRAPRQSATSLSMRISMAAASVGVTYMLLLIQFAHSAGSPVATMPGM
jgi:hypothetical protein